MNFEEIENNIGYYEIVNKHYVINESKRQKYEKFVCQYAEGSIPNTEFVTHLNNHITDNNRQYFQKGYWEFFADVLILRGENGIQNIIEDLFVWLQDMNWPGAQKIWDFLLTIKTETFDRELEKVLLEAVSDIDTTWFVNLIMLNEAKYGKLKFSNQKLQKLSEKIQELEYSDQDSLEIEKLQTQILKDFNFHS